MRKFAIIVAGGSGSRMKSEIPKQFLLYSGEPIIIKTLRKFQEAYDDIEIVVVLPEKHLSHWVALEKHFPFTSKIKTALGGATRTDSVKSGLEEIHEDGLVAVHDAVRPFTSIETITSSFDSAEKKGSGVAAVTLKDSIREVLANDRSEARDRKNYVLVQTPQTFDSKKLKLAYQKAGDATFTDDATVFEKAGFDVHLVKGSYANIKITTPEDISNESK